MEASAKKQMLKVLLKSVDDSEDELLTTYLEFAKREIISWIYGYSRYPDIAKATDSSSIAVMVNVNMFVAKLSPISGNAYTFTYSEESDSWQYNSATVDLIDYGLIYPTTATPEDAETIIVKYNENYLAQWDMVQIMACMAGYGISGAEGQLSHSENGISRTWKYSDMVQYIHDNIPAYCGVA